MIATLRRRWLLWRAERAERAATELWAAAGRTVWKAASLNHTQAARAFAGQAARLRQEAGE